MVQELKEFHKTLDLVCASWAALDTVMYSEVPVV